MVEFTTRQKEIRQKAWAHLDNLTKPPRSLGKIEELATALCAIQETLHPETHPRSVIIFAGDHGVCEEGVSAYPQAVTGQMLRNMANGGACVSVLSQLYHARLRLVDVGTTGPHETLLGVDRAVVREGTANFTQESAMTARETQQALLIGEQTVEQELAKGSRVFGFGEMGIGNSTAAAAVTACVLARPAEDVVGLGTGVDESGLAKKTQVIKAAMLRHQGQLECGIEILQRVGGLELAALAGGIIKAATQKCPVVLDGFICTAAAAVAADMQPAICPCLIASHRSSEPGHQPLLDHLNCAPLFEFNMRLGEGSGALLALPILDAAAALYNQMATFNSAGISGHQ